MRVGAFAMVRGQANRLSNGSITYSIRAAIPSASKRCGKAPICCCAVPKPVVEAEPGGGWKALGFFLDHGGKHGLEGREVLRAEWKGGVGVGDEGIAERLELFLAKRIDGALSVNVLGLERSTEGFSQETFTFEADIDRGGARERRGYVVKREPEAGLLEPYDLEPEFRVLHALSQHPLPSPPTPFFSADPADLDRPFYVMERLPGEVPVPASRADGSGPFADAERGSLGPQVVRALEQLHAIDWRGQGLDFLGVPDPGTGAAARELAGWEERIVRAGFPLAPMLADTLQWLRSHLPDTQEVTLLHGDYRLGNFLVEGDGEAMRLTGVLDWELVHLGDPHEDLAWCSSELWRGGTPYASGLMPPDEFASAYAAASGRAVDPERLKFYSVFSVVKMMAIMLTGIRAFTDGRSKDLRMAIFNHQLGFLHALLAVTRGWLPGV